MKLDVGCGNRPNGDVNVDTALIEGYVITNFVRADAEHLPFRNNVFSHSCSSHAIEHVDHPLVMIEEMKRVTRRLVEIATPLFLSYNYRFWLSTQRHKHWFSPFWFRKLGFHTKVTVHFLRPPIIKNKRLVAIPFFSIVARLPL